MEEMSGQLSSLKLAQQQVIESYEKFGALQLRLDALSAMTPNYPRGHTMLHDRKKKILDEMDLCLTRVSTLCGENPGAGSVEGLGQFREAFAHAVNGSGAGSDGFRRVLEKIERESTATRESARELAKGLRSVRLREKRKPMRRTRRPRDSTPPIEHTWPRA